MSLHKLNRSTTYINLIEILIQLWCRF